MRLFRFGSDDTETESGKSQTSEVGSISSKSTAATSQLPPFLIKRQTPFEQPVNPIKPPKFDLSFEQEKLYEQLLGYYQDYITKEIPIDDSHNAPTHPITEEELGWLSKECLLRYLRASKWKLDVAIKRLHETIIWRRSFGVVHIPNNTNKNKLITANMVAAENETGKQLIVGYDNDNRPCLYLRNGYQNTSGGLRQVQHLVFMLERVIQFMPPGQDSLALLIDFKAAPSELKLSSKFPSLSTSQQCLHILQSHYPERLGRGLFTNIPLIGQAFFKLVGPFIDPHTRSKTIYDQPFANFVPAEQLDKEFQGLVDFQYVHDIYWPKMNEIAEYKHKVYMENFRRLGSKIGLSEYDLRLEQKED
ncbi:PDR17 [Candida oxycetoniae]|uniref:SEC14 homolog 3 n=1 Tax=Candida oxycetoniae TaxID=497107 RepID=A0AAI9SX89_9ASCO|nr:PDR17 [Candida oxycetoniae]KAI3404386.2 PDR17 [Candida oxycetoniae]